MRLIHFTQRVIATGLICLITSACGAPVPAPMPVMPVAVAGTIEISEPRVRLPASGQTQTAAYLTLINTVSQSDRLVGVTSPDAKKLELHAHTKTADGMMMMRQLDSIEVPQGATIPLVPGGLHIMVKDVKADLKLGDAMPIELTFASGAKAVLTLPIVANPRSESEGGPQSKPGHQH